MWVCHGYIIGLKLKWRMHLSKLLVFVSLGLTPVKDKMTKAKETNDGHSSSTDSSGVTHGHALAIVNKHQQQAFYFDCWQDLWQGLLVFSGQLPISIQWNYIYYVRLDGGNTKNISTSDISWTCAVHSTVGVLVLSTKVWQKNMFSSKRNLMVCRTRAVKELRYEAICLTPPD